MKLILKQMFSGPKGEVSSKRVIAILAFIVAVILAFKGKPDVGLVGIFLGLTTAIFGIQAGTKT